MNHSTLVGSLLVVTPSPKPFLSKQVTPSIIFLVLPVAAPFLVCLIILVVLLLLNHVSLVVHLLLQLEDLQQIKRNKTNLNVKQRRLRRQESRKKRWLKRESW